MMVALLGELVVARIGQIQTGERMGRWIASSLSTQKEKFHQDYETQLDAMTAAGELVPEICRYHIRFIPC